MLYHPKVSIIVPVYNADGTIEACIHSLLGLNYPKENLEIILVDNASTDNTSDILTKYSKVVKTLYEEKSGCGAARNRGLLNATGDIIAFTDSDCEVDKDWLRYIVCPLQKDDVGIVGGRILAKRPYNKIEEFGEEIHDNNRAINEFKPAYVDTANWASRLSVLKIVGGFDKEFTRGEDTDLAWRILRADYRLVYEPEAVVYHRNERSFWGLFCKGYVHGFHSLRCLKKHELLLKQFRYRRFNLNRYIALVWSLIDYVRGRRSDYAICYFTFNVGREIGRFLGIVFLM